MGRFWLCWRALLAHWRRHPLQATCLLLGLWLATALWSGVQALNTQARDSYQRAAELFGGAQQSLLVADGGGLIDQNTYVQLRRAGWPVSPLLQGSLMFDGPAGPQRLQVVGIEPLTLPNEGPLARVVEETGELQRFLLDQGQSWIAVDSLAELGWQQGQRPQAVNARPLPALQVRAAVPPGTLVMDIGQAQQLLDLPGQLSELLVEQGFAAQQPALPQGINLLWQQREEAELARLTDSFHLNLTALGLLAFVVGLFIVHAAAGLAVQQRRSMLQGLRSCGVSLRLLAVLLLAELLLLALLAGSLGLLSGRLLAGWLLADLAGSLRGLYGTAVAARLQLPWHWWLSGLGMALLGSLLAGAASFWQGLRLPVLQWARPQAWRAAQRRLLRWQALTGLLLVGLGVCLWWLGDGLASGLLLLACVLLGAALLLPPWLAGLLGLARRLSRRPLVRWFWADSQQQLGGLGLALMALLLTLAANTGVGSMTSGFRLTFEGWLQQRLAADVYLRADSPEQASTIEQWLLSQPEVSAVLPSWQRQAQFQGWPVELSGILEHPLYADSWPLLQADEDVWPRLAAAEGVLLSEQLLRRLQLSVGDSLTLEMLSDRPSLRVLGSYADYGNPRGQVLMDAGLLRQAWPQLPPRSFAVLLEHGDPALLVERIRQALGLPGNQAIDQRSLQQWSSRVFEQTFAATSALNRLVLLVAVLGLFGSLLTLADSRLLHLAPLWAVGLSARQLAWLSLLQMLSLACLTLLLAIPLGLLLAWLLVDVVNVQAFGWRLPWHWFPLQWLQLAGLAMLAVTLACLWPLWRLRSHGPMNMLRQFVHE